MRTAVLQVLVTINWRPRVSAHRHTAFRKAQLVSEPLASVAIVEAATRLSAKRVSQRGSLLHSQCRSCLGQVHCSSMFPFLRRYDIRGIKAPYDLQYDCTMLQGLQNNVP